MDTSGCTFVKAGPPMIESLLSSRERLAAGVSGGECIVDAAADLWDEDDSADVVCSRDACCDLGSFEGTCSAPRTQSAVTDNENAESTSTCGRTWAWTKCRSANDGT